jgi:DNA-binding phage protein
MARRSKDWNEGLAKDLRDIDFAQKFILSAVEDESLPLQMVLGKVIRAYGVKEFAKLVKMPSSNLLRAINPKHNPTQETLSRLLKPFGLAVTVAPIKTGKRAG